VRIFLRSLPALLFVGWLASSSLARADAPLAPNPEAVAFFDAGRKLMATGDYAGAIPKFVQSLKSTRTVGSLLNLGTCYEKVGRMASAWATYRAGASLARELHDAREADGDRFASAVESRVSHLTIDARAIERVEGVEVTLDGVPVGPGARGEEMPVDAGRHVVDVSAPRKRKQTAAVEVAPNGARATVAIPPLEDAPLEAVSRLTVPPPGAEPNARRTAGFVIGGVGLASLAGGVVTGLMAMSKHQQATAACSSYPDHCDPSGAADAPNEASKTLATISTAALVAGGVAVATGAVLVLTAPNAGRTASVLRVTPLVALGTVGASAGFSW
jgi:hypothetical protein